MRKESNFETPTTSIVLQSLIDYLGNGPATMLDLIAATGKSGGRGRAYIMHLRQVGRIICMAEAVNTFKGSTPSVWALNPAYVEADVVDGDGWPRVTIRSTWAPHHARNPMDCLLFGVPAAMQALAFANQ